MTLCIQDPEDIHSDSLLDSILEATSKASGGSGFFSWVTAYGVNLLMEDSDFLEFLESSEFDLVVGVDTITTPAALQKLGQLSATHPNLKTSVFMHDRNGALFHPKACWFRRGTRATLIVGSGNLTGGGLKTNWEAFSVETLSASEASRTAKLWQDWKSFHHARLFALDHPDAVRRAKQNERVIIRAKRSRRPAERALVADLDFPSTIVAPTDEVFVGEVPGKTNKRWNQVNVRKTDYFDYFGAKKGQKRRVLFQHVDASGKLSALEGRQLVIVKSQNYRFEVTAAAHLPYPTTGGKPILVCVRAAGGVFRYSLLMPGDATYAATLAFLVSKHTGPANQVRRVRTSVSVLKAAVPALGLWRAPN